MRGTVLEKSDPQHPHTIDIDKADELLALMQKAGVTASGATEPDRRASN